MLLP
ncbi:hypothetical protein CGLO_14894 [Colletotrichum gloeosporioides Cg-14]|jgi:DNA-directed RNA polymerase III subunit RPC1